MSMVEEFIAFPSEELLGLCMKDRDSGGENMTGDNTD